MDNNIISVTGISEPLLHLIDERVRQKGGDRDAYIRDLIERDIYGSSVPHSSLGISKEQKHLLTPQEKKRPFDPQQWEDDLKLLTTGASEIPVLPPFAFTRESIYGNHD
ncbi:hypothetical protein F7734_17410 [Scytonema sp. UIC 10036]|uniref:hypothetical protein n=1 Tax=Scytonema sp. UIC 10036 TaxID=2304196 RepID=UPI0012DA8B8E|nr:hypothetical protein [Scytonema sp. UIC 10036]MUG94071.1 hypothetical protein [Scytonema sp. UIC 10036]